MAKFGGGQLENHPVHSFPRALVYSRDTALFLGLQGGSKHLTGAGWSWAFTESNTLLLFRTTVHVYGGLGLDLVFLGAWCREAPCRYGFGTSMLCDGVPLWVVWPSLHACF